MLKDNTKNSEAAKEAAGKAAVELIEDGMLVGLGTGSTAAYFIDHLIKKCQQGLRITAVATSEQTAQKAQKAGIPLLDLGEFTTLDLTVDGADEIDPSKRLIKGRGGALVREKIVASSSQRMIVIADSSKLVDRLGHAPLPVEIIPFGYNATLKKIEEAGYNKPILRVDGQGNPIVTDNHNFLANIHFTRPLLNPGRDNQKILNIPGVVDTGLFFHLAINVLVGYPDGHVDFL